MADYDPFNSLENQERGEQADAQRKFRERQEKEDIQWLMGSKRGRRVVYGLLDRAGVFRSVFDTDALKMAFSEGLRNEGLRITLLVNAHCSDRWTVMIRESEKEWKDAPGR